mmetsp:Transcript_4468/g.12525  ORF Transcript_4468/g.12525 Transcript_4468/m.12525 type:complete len:190 (-) Transcript_4468:93-662(-)
MSASLPKLMSEEENSRLMRRLGHNARANEGRAKLEAHNFVHRERSLNTMKELDRSLKEAVRAAHEERVQRWTEKLSSSPFHVDQWAQDEAKYHQSKKLLVLERKNKARMERQQQEAHNLILDRASADIDELEMLRAEKRRLVENTKKLKAMKDVEKTNSRVAKAFHMKHQTELDRQQKLMFRALSSPAM